MRRFWRIGLLVALLVCLVLPGGKQTAVLAQDEAPTITQQAQAIFEGMSVPERVGQVFLVTFEGDSAPRSSDIADLILNNHIGGVLLLAGNDNITGFDDPDNAPGQVAALADDLQRLTLLGYSTAVEPTEPELAATPINENEPTPTAVPSPTPVPRNTTVPLFIAISQEGDGPVYDQIFNGLTAVPNNMAVGATWQPDNAKVIGKIVGRELSALGVNMLLGPSLDVLEDPVMAGDSAVGARSFGGDPYWVGLMGEAYVAGLHQGSDGRLAVIAKHFPGNGSSDRPTDQEIPTIRKSLDQLLQTELVPFMAVTQQTDDERAGVIDGLLSTHIRYQGFQGNIRATTAPVSFDRQALATLMGLPAFAPWYQNGGLIVSDSLGVRSIERYYDDTEQEFPHRRVAKDAFLAGNDLLMLSDFALGDAPYSVQLENMQNTVLWFQELYVTDPTFRQRLDEAVLRILEAKLRLYGGDFSPENVLVESQNLGEELGQGDTAVFDMAQSAITLISPSPEELAERLARPPGPGDRILIFTDLREAQQCTTCPPQPYIGEDALAQHILTLYGPEASGQVQPEQITSFTFADLQAFVDAGPEPIVIPTATPQPTPEVTDTPELDAPVRVPTGTPEPTPTIPPAFLVQETFNAGVDWIVFAMLDDTDIQAVQDFLAQRPNLLRNRQVIAFAYNAPYYLDSTEISKLTAYYGVYSKIDAFIDASARALFLELPLSGRSPVDIEGISYSVARQTEPDPEQVIELYVIDDSGSAQSPSSEAPLETSVGDTLRLQTGIIRDRNGHPVPDGTMVQFIQRDRIQGTLNIIAEVPTTNGMAQLDYVLQASTGPGKFRITAVSGDAQTSEEVDILIEGAAQVAVITPTPAPTDTPTVTPTPTDTPMPTHTPAPTITATAVAPLEPPEEPILSIALSEFTMLFTVLCGLTVVGILGYTLGLRYQVNLTWQVGWILWGPAGALLIYIYYALGLPGTAVLASFGVWAGLITTILGGVAGLFTYTFAKPPNGS
ncbi:MAG: hypothetical protein KC441_16025 [Anaerolineales bacterium]|nr:hypothetical protein [Anaerolineales bacterium]